MSSELHVQKYWDNPRLWKQYGHGEIYRERIDIIKRMLPDGINSILDVGAGKGDVANELYQSYSQVNAIDISSEALNYVKCPSQVGTVEALPFESRSIDVVMCMEVLEHLAPLSFKQGIAELQRVANQYLLIGVPYNENIDARKTRCPSCGYIFNADTHFRSFESVESLSSNFPEFRLVSHVFGGENYKKPSRLGVFIKQKIGRAYIFWEPSLTCLECGFSCSEDVEEKQGIKKKILELINSSLCVFMDKQRYWQFVLLERVN